MHDPKHEVIAIQATIAKGVGLPILDISTNSIYNHPQLFLDFDEALDFCEKEWAPKLIKTQNTGKEFKILRGPMAVNVCYMDWLNRATLPEDGSPAECFSQIVPCEIRFRIRIHVLPDLIINKLMLLGE
jgi:hypothetical protein